MAFDQSSITELNLSRDGRELFVSWTSTAPAGQTFQLYSDGILTYWGTDRAVHLPWPTGARNHRIGVGTVAVGEERTDFSGSLPAVPLPYRTLSWEGGTYLDLDIAGFRVYGEATPGGGIDYSTPIAIIPAYPAGIVTSGFGMGGFGRGGFGRSASTYTYQTASLGNGAWTFAVASYDTAGNEAASPPTVGFTVAVPPRPPAADAYGSRLAYSYNASTHVATLNWLASPG